MKEPKSKFPTMGNTAAKNVRFPSATPERGVLVKKKNTAAGNLYGPKADKPHKVVTSGRKFAIRAKMPAWSDPQIGPVQGNGRMFKSAVNRTAPNFKDGMSNFN
jgi:hypothetical protein